MADTRYIIRQEHGGETRVIGDGALPFFLNQGYVVVDTVDAPPTSAQVALPVIHGADADALRPDTDQPVVWYGDVTPANLDTARGDEWATGGSAASSARSLVPASSRPRLPALGGLTNGTDTGMMTRFRMVATTDVTQVSVTYGNFTGGGEGEAAGVDPFNLRASVEHNGAIFPLYFAGRRSTVVLEPGAVLDSDPLFVGIPEGATFWVRTYVSVSTPGQKWPWGVMTAVPDWEAPGGEGDGAERGTSVTDKTLSGTVTTSTEYAYGPISVRCYRDDAAMPVAVILGDSVAFGSGDVPQGTGYIFRALDAAGIATMNLGIPGTQAAEFTPAKASTRLRLAMSATHAVVGFGVNDINGGQNAATVQANLLAVWQRLADLGLKVYATTLTPRTTSTDSWATAGNQAVVATEAVRVAVNTWIRTQPAPLAGVFDAADALETARNSGKWKNGLTGDGVHPNAAGHLAAVLAIDTALIAA